jgi:thiol-disulfide isomerase/thioredoxin
MYVTPPATTSSVLRDDRRLSAHAAGIGTTVQRRSKVSGLSLCPALAAGVYLPGLWRCRLVENSESRVRVVSFVRGEVKELSPWGDGVLLMNGTKAPDIEMVGLANGKSERLSDYAGKIIVLEFWATWCGPCQPKMADLQTYSGKYPDWKGKVVLIAASVDDEEEAPTKHLKAKGWGQTHNVWVGTDAKKAYHVDAIPTAYVFDRQGKIVATNPMDIPEIVSDEAQKK